MIYEKKNDCPEDLCKFRPNTYYKQIKTFLYSRNQDDTFLLCFTKPEFTVREN